MCVRNRRNFLLCLHWLLIAKKFLKTLNLSFVFSLKDRAKRTEFYTVQWFVQNANKASPTPDVVWQLSMGILWLRAPFLLEWTPKIQISIFDAKWISCTDRGACALPRFRNRRSVLARSWNWVQNKNKTINISITFVSSCQILEQLFASFETPDGAIKSATKLHCSIEW